MLAADNPRPLLFRNLFGKFRLCIVHYTAESGGKFRPCRFNGTIAVGFLDDGFKGVIAKAETNLPFHRVKGRLVFFKDAVFNVFPKLSCNRETDTAVVFPLIERVIRIGYKESIFAFHNTETPNL